VNASKADLDPKIDEAERKVSAVGSESNVSAAEPVSDSNPFMSIKAQSFKPKAFVPSPNK